MMANYSTKQQNNKILAHSITDNYCNKKGYFTNMYEYHNCPLSINPQNGQNKRKAIIDSKLCPRLLVYWMMQATNQWQ